MCRSIYLLLHKIFFDMSNTAGFSESVYFTAHSMGVARLIRLLPPPPSYSHCPKYQHEVKYVEALYTAF